MTNSFEQNNAAIDVVALTHILNVVAENTDKGEARYNEYPIQRIPRLVANIERLLNITVKAIRFSDYQKQTEIRATANLNYSLPVDMVQALMEQDYDRLANTLGPVLGLWTFRTVGEAA